MAARRSTGTGALEIRKDKQGNETYYGRFYAHGRQVRKRLGRKRKAGTRDGLTKAQAERALREAINVAGNSKPTERSAHTIRTAGAAYIDHLEQVAGRKPSTIRSYRIILDKHLAPFFGDIDLAKIDADLIERFRTDKSRERQPKTVHNMMMFLSGLFTFASSRRRRWVSVNPVGEIDRGSAPERNEDIRFLSIEELRAVVHAVPAGEFQQTDRAIIITAALTGMRLGELRALRWRDVDWINQVVRVRKSFTYGEFGKPKSKGSVRTIPMSDQVAAELDRLSQLSRFTDDDDLVFGHPELGDVQDADRLRRRYQRALNAAGVRPVRFHDLRHTFGTQLASNGTPLVAIQKWMGHADIDTTMIYAAWSNDPFQGGEHVDRAFQGLTEGHKLTPTQTNSNQPAPL